MSASSQAVIYVRISSEEQKEEHQIPIDQIHSDRQYPITKPAIWVLEFGYWLLFGAWDLVIGYSDIATELFPI